MKKKDALYAEAESVYKAFHKESIRLSRGGGSRTPTPALERTSSGQALADIAQIFRNMHEQGTRVKGEDPHVVISRLPGAVKAESVVALSVCTDSTGWGYYKGSKLLSRGRVGMNDVYFSFVSGSLKIIGADGRKAASCG